MNDTRGHLHPMQVAQLRQPINPARVLKDGKGMSHLSQQDVVAHLTRIFGYGSFDVEILSLDVVYEDAHPHPKRTQDTVWDVCYRATVRLTVRNTDGETVAVYEDVSTDTAQNQRLRGDAHDLAAKSAVSLAKKRCAVHLGDQYGASLYNGGMTAPLVIQQGQVTLPEYIRQQDGRGEEPQTAPDVQQDVPVQTDLGDVDPESRPAPEANPADVQANLDRAGGQQ